MTVGRGCGRFKGVCSGSLKPSAYHPTGRLTGPKSNAVMSPKSNAEVGFAGAVPTESGPVIGGRKPTELDLTSVVRHRNKMPPRPHNEGVAARLPSWGIPSAQSLPN